MHALDHPSYGDSARVPRETTGAAYLDLMHELIVEMFPGVTPLRFAGFSFGGAIATHLARRLAPRVTHLCLISPGGFPMRRFGERPIRSYREAGDDEALFREVCRHNLLVNMLSDPASVTEETVDIQVDNVRRTRFDSRKVSGGGTLLDDLAQSQVQDPPALGRARRLALSPRRRSSSARSARPSAPSTCTGFPPPATGRRTRTRPRSIAG